MKSKINDDNLPYVHRSLLEREYMELVERRNNQVGIAFVAGIWVGTVATLLVTLWWLP